MTETQIVREFRDGFKISVRLKRGSATRDEDKLSYTVHGETMERAEERAERAAAFLDELASDVRQIQPEADEVEA